MKYTCAPCNYESCDFSNWDKHRNTQKHIKKTTQNTQSKTAPEKHPKTPQNTEPVVIFDEQLNTCKKCGLIFTRRSSLLRHLKTCNSDETINLKAQIENIEKAKNMEIESLKLQLMNAQREAQKAEENAKYLRTVIDSTGILAHKSVSALTYLATKHKDAPPLKEIGYEDAKKLLKYDTDKRLIKRLITHYKHNKLDKFIGEIIIKHYKKDNPADQSIWNSDASRLTFLIKNIVGKESEWITDKKGVKMRNLVIQPIVNLVEDLIKEYADKSIDNNDSDMSNSDQYSDTSESEEGDEKMSNTTHAIGLLQYISSKNLEEDISRYISPRFNLTKQKS